MLSILSDADCEALLSRNWYAHLGCATMHGEPYVIPITYVYHEGSIISFTKPGRKIDIMSENPQVCVQVEELSHEDYWQAKSADQWQSVMAFGRFVSLSGKEAQEARMLMAKHLEDISTSQNKKAYLPIRHAIDRINSPEDMVIFAIRLQKISGRKDTHGS